VSVASGAWCDQQTGDNRTAQRVLAEIASPILRRATTRITIRVGYVVSSTLDDPE
jgi:hypothetical protein